MNTRAELESTVCIDDQQNPNEIIDPWAYDLVKFSPYIKEAFPEPFIKRRFLGAAGETKASWLAWKINGSDMPKQYKARVLTVTTI